MRLLDVQDITQMVRLFNIAFNRVDQGDGTVFTIEDFGLQVVFNVHHFKYDEENWRYVDIAPTDNLEDKRYEVLWQLIRGGYFHYLRIEYPNTFKKMLAGLNYDRRLIEERLRVYGNKPKYKYFKDMNNLYKEKSAVFVMSTDPGFYDFLQE